MTVPHKRPQDKWNYGDNLNIPPYIWNKQFNPSPHSGGKGRKVFGIILGIFMLLVVVGLLT